MLLTGIDLGTTGVKVVVFDRKGKVLSLKYENYNMEAVHGRRELQAAELWKSCTRVMSAAMAECPHSKEGAICVSSFGEGFVCLDEAGNEISPVMLLTDDRGSREFEEAMERIGDEQTAQICGLKPHLSYSLSKILYLKKYCQDIYSRTRHILLMGDYFYYKLAGIFCTDYSLASRTMLFDVHKKEWSPGLLDCVGIEAGLFGSPVQGGSVVGEVSRKMTEELGLPQKTMLVMGGHDQTVAAVTGQGKTPYTLCSMGTSECITPVLEEPLPWQQILESAHPNEPFMKPGVYNTLAYNVTSGLLTEWSTKVLAQAERRQGDNVYDILQSEMPQEPTRMLVLPYLHGSGTPYLDPSARLSILGMDEVTRRGDIYRAVLEGLCLDQRLNMELLGWDKIGQGGILATGGGSRSRKWLQIKADVLGQPIHRLECHQAGALGCAVLCSLAAGIYDSMEEAVGEMVRKGDAILPNEANHQFYNEKYQIYQTLYETLKDVNAYSRG